jgi:hypothetical protein
MSMGEARAPIGQVARGARRGFPRACPRASATTRAAFVALRDQRSRARYILNLRIAEIEQSS